MSKKMLRSVLVAAFSAVMAFGALGGLSGVESDSRVQADSTWPSAVKSPGDSTWPAPPVGGVDDGAGG